MNRNSAISELVETFRMKWIEEGFDDALAASKDYMQELKDKTDEQLEKELRLVRMN